MTHSRWRKRSAAEVRSQYFNKRGRGGLFRSIAVCLSLDALVVVAFFIHCVAVGIIATVDVVLAEVAFTGSALASMVVVAVGLHTAVVGAGAIATGVTDGESVAVVVDAAVGVTNALATDTAFLGVQALIIVATFVFAYATAVTVADLIGFTTFVDAAFVGTIARTIGGALSAAIAVGIRTAFETRITRADTVLA